MKTIKAIAVGFLSVFAMTSANAQVEKVEKVKKYPEYYGDPKIKIKNDDANTVIRSKGYSGYYNNRPYYYDAQRHLYYQVYNEKRIYYRRGWVPY